MKVWNIVIVLWRHSLLVDGQDRGIVGNLVEVQVAEPVGVEAGEV